MMHRLYRLSLLAFVSAALSGCASFIDAPSRPKVVTAEGLGRDVDGGSKDNLADLRYRFMQAAKAATPNSAFSDPGPAAQRQFLRSGFTLVYVSCNRYLESKSDRQRDLNVVQDSFAPITALTTGLIGLIDSGDSINNKYLTAIGLITGAASAGFESYERRYLFSAENMESVRELVLTALIDNSKIILQTPESEMNFEQSIIHLINNQAICSPSKILQLVNGAIKAGTVSSKFVNSAESGATSSETQQTAILDILIAEGAISEDVLAEARAQLVEQQEQTASSLDAVFTDTAQPNQ